MSKVLMDTEVVKIITDTVNKQPLPPQEYERFIGSLGEVVAEHFGGYVHNVSAPMGVGKLEPNDRFCVHFKADERVPLNGGPYAEFDTDVTVDDWMAESTPEQNRANG